MRIPLVIILVFIFGQSINAQSLFFTASDTLNKKRTIYSSIGIGCAWSGSMIGLSQVWYKDVTKTQWHTFDDAQNWLQMDKFGHLYTAYHLNKLTSNLYTWSGINNKRSVIIGSCVSLGYQTTLEMLDAYAEEWGFSWSDMAGNAIGTGLFTLQQLTFKEQRVIPKFSYHPTKFASIRPDVLGDNPIESFLKDYNGQTYWLSTNIGSFFPNSSIPSWLCISIGYSAHQKLVGDQSSFYSSDDNFEFVEQREWLLSLDIDLSKLPIKRPWLKMLVNQFNYLKVPCPSLLLRNNVVYGKLLYF